MRFKNSSMIVIPALSMLLASEAGAVPVQAQNPAFQEIDGKGGARTMIAAHWMGAWGMAKTAPEALQIKALIDATDMDDVVFDCLNISNGSTWPEGCSPQAIVKIVSQLFAAHKQSWIMSTYLGSKKALALTNQITAMNVYKSPVAAPLYGHVDHWITIRKMDVSGDYKVVNNVEYFDAGDGAYIDQEGTAYKTGLQPMSGIEYANTYYQIVPDNVIDTSDYNVGKYIFSWDPPAGARLPQNPPPVRFARGMGLVEPGEMTQDLAPVLVWDALDAQGLLANPDYADLLLATPGDAWTVRGVRPSGAAWDYIVVPMYADDMRGVIALVGLSADDGAFERAWMVGGAPLDLPGRAEAEQRASKLLGRGETLAAGALTWDPACGEGHCRQPLLPYHEFAVRSKDGQRVGQITVPMGGRAAQRR